LPNVLVAEHRCGARLQRWSRVARSRTLPTWPNSRHTIMWLSFWLTGSLITRPRTVRFKDDTQDLVCSTVATQPREIRSSMWLHGHRARSMPTLTLVRALALAPASLVGKSKNELRSTTPGDAKAALKIVTETHAHWEALVHPLDQGDEGGPRQRPAAAKDFFLVD